jgi:hypothetical protein
VAFTTKTSATELVAMVNVVDGEESVIDSAVIKFNGAAFARKITPHQKTTKNTIAHTIRLFFIMLL